MKKILYLLVLTANAAFAQVMPNTFKVGNYAEVLPGDSLKAYYSCSGVLCSSQCASFYRVGMVDSTGGNLRGELGDYYMNGNPMFKATMKLGYLEGPATYYYDNGQVKESGSYNNDKRAGTWKYYYDNGKPEKVINYNGADFAIIEQYDSTGTKTVENGNGFYNGTFKITDACDTYTISGKVSDGKPDGNWSIYRSVYHSLVTRENYKKGVFVNGVDANDRIYDQYPLLNISGFYPNENVVSYENHADCPNKYAAPLLFRSKPLTQLFYPNLIGDIKSYYPLQNQWLIVSISFKKNDEIDEINVYSSINDAPLEQYIYNNLLSITNEWSPIRLRGEKIPQPLFFTIYINKAFGTENVLIPAEYLYRRNAGGK